MVISYLSLVRIREGPAKQDVVWGGVYTKVKLFVFALVLLTYFKGSTSLAKPINIHQTFDGIIIILNGTLSLVFM